MDYELLQHKAEQICNSDTCNGPLNHNTLGGGMWIMTSYSFSCSGNITSLLLGGDLRLDEDNHPTISLWSRQGEGSTIYNKVVSSDRTLSLDPYNFSTSGPLLYHLSEPLQFESGQVLGLRHYGNSGILRLYYINNSNQSMIYKLEDVNSNTINTQDNNDIDSSKTIIGQVLLYLYTSNYTIL